MYALICGSLAYDTIMVFPDHFKKHILPDKIHMLSVSFLVPEMRQEFGGCAGNISYNLKMLGGEPLPMAAVGRGFEPYREYFTKLDINLDCVRYIDEEFTSQCFITTDLDGNQITAFHPGAMQLSHLNKIPEIKHDISIGIIGPDGREGMLSNSQGFSECGIPHIFDPGQAMPLFDGEEFKGFIERANWVALNEYEAQLIMDRTGWNEQQIAQRVEAMFITHGGKGSSVYTEAGEVQIEAVKPESIQDPTGCGDAYRAGLIYGISNDMDLETAARLGSLMGSLKIACQGPQNHKFSQAEIAEKFKQSFGYSYQ